MKQLTLTRKWWSLGLRGLAALTFGILALSLPGLTLASLVLVLGAFLMVDGFFAVIAGFSRREKIWWTGVLWGLVGIAGGYIAFTSPGVGAAAILLMVAAAAIIKGVLEIAIAMQLRREIHGEWALFLAGLLSIVFGILLFTNPSAGLIVITWIVGIYALMFATLLLYLSYQMKKYNIIFQTQFTDNKTANFMAIKSTVEK